MKSIFEQAANWQQPTVKEVETIMIKAASNLGCEVKNLYSYFDGDARTFRRWKENADKNPAQASSIKYSPFALLVAIASCDVAIEKGQRKAKGGEIIFTGNKKPLEPVNKELWQLIQDNYVFTADNFERPSEKIVKFFYGKDSVTGMFRQDLAAMLGYDKNHFGRLIVRMNFGTWASLMLCMGVPVSRLFDFNRTS